MALDINETAYTPVNARIVQDRTALRALDVTAPAVEQAAIGFAEGQVRREMETLQGSLQQTRAYIDSLRARQAALDPADAESLAASEDLAREIDRTIKGQNQGLMNASQAETRISSKVRELSRRFPVAAPALRSFVSQGSAYTTAQGIASDLAAEEERVRRIEQQIDSDMVKWGLNPLNPIARGNFIRTSRELQALNKRKALAQTLSAELAQEEAEYQLSRRGVRERQQDITLQRAEVGLTRETEALDEERRERRLSETQRELSRTLQSTLIPDTTNQVLNIIQAAPMENGRYTDPATLSTQIIGVFNAARSVYAQEAALTGLDPAALNSTFTDLQTNYLSMVENGTLTNFLDSQRKLMEAGYGYNAIRQMPQAAIMTNIFGAAFMEKYAEAQAVGGEKLARFKETFQLDSLNQVIDLTTRWQNRELTLEEVDRLSEQATNNPLPPPAPGTTAPMAPSWDTVYDALPLGRSTRFWQGEGARYAKDNPDRLRNYFESELTSLRDSPDVRAVTENGYSFSYDQGTKTLVMLDAQGNYAQHYTIPQGRTSTQRQALGSRVQGFLNTVPGYGQQTQPTVTATMGGPIVSRPGDRIELGVNSMRRMTEQLETLRVHKNLLPEYNQGNYFTMIRNQ